MKCVFIRFIISDFGIHCPFWFSQVAKLQSKLILQVLVRLCSTQKYDVSLEALKAFLPKTMDDYTQAVLSPALARALLIWHRLVHTEGVNASQSKQLEDALAAAPASLTPKEIVDYHRPLARLQSLTHFKKLLNDGHKIIASIKMDQEAESSVLSVKSKIATIEGWSELTVDSTGTDFTFSSIADRLKDWPTSLSLVSY